MTAPTQTLAELSRAVAEKIGFEHHDVGIQNEHWCGPKSWNHVDAGYLIEDFFSRPEVLYELEGELQKAGWTFYFDSAVERSVKAEPRWIALSPHGELRTEPGTAEGRVRLILRAYLEAGL